MGGAGAHWQQVVVARDVAVPGEVVWVLRVTGNHCSTTCRHNTYGWFWGNKNQESGSFISFI